MQTGGDDMFFCVSALTLAPSDAWLITQFTLTL